MNKGKLKQWNDEKGYGFIAPFSGGRDIFIHISAFKKSGRSPIIGDVIYYNIHSENDGKTRAVNATIEGVEKTERYSTKARPGTKRNEKSSNKIISIIISISIAAFTYMAISLSNTAKVNDSNMPSLLKNTDDLYRNFSCQGKTHCSEMASCEEAMFYQKNCPGTEIDGDNDGIPCESQWCGG